jgi:hypothetical protein
MLDKMFGSHLLGNHTRRGLGLKLKRVMKSMNKF